MLFGKYYTIHGKWYMIVLITIYCEVMVMVLERRFSGSYNKLMKMIKRDLLKNFGEKGIQISSVNVVLGKNKLKLKMSMRQWQHLREAFKASLKYLLKFFFDTFFLYSYKYILKYVRIYFSFSITYFDCYFTLRYNYITGDENLNGDNGNWPWNCNSGIRDCKLYRQ